MPVLTLCPQIWNDIAKDLTLQAARAAGMNESHVRIKTVSEPEAAAVHCLKTFHETKDSLKVHNLFYLSRRQDNITYGFWSFLQVGDVYVIADCGGGTVVGFLTLKPTFLLYLLKLNRNFRI